MAVGHCGGGGLGINTPKHQCLPCAVLWQVSHTECAHTSSQHSVPLPSCGASASTHLPAGAVKRWTNVRRGSVTSSAAVTVVQLSPPASLRRCSSQLAKAAATSSGAAVSTKSLTAAGDDGGGSGRNLAHIMLAVDGITWLGVAAHVCGGQAAVLARSLCCRLTQRSSSLGRAVSLALHAITATALASACL